MSSGAQTPSDPRNSPEGNPGNQGHANNTDAAAPHALAAAIGRKQRRPSEGIALGLLFGCAAFSIFITAGVVGVLFTQTAKFFSFPGASVVQFLTSTHWNPREGIGDEVVFGVWGLIIGTVNVAFWASCIAIPFGLITAIYLSEYAPKWLRNTLKPILEILAGVPTVVYGFFAIAVITPTIQTILPVSSYNVLAAGIAVGIMCLPIVCSLTEDTLQAVPRSLREGAYALGATKFDTSVRVVTPAALSGIVAASLLTVARAVGETMIVTLAAGNLARHITGSNPFSWIGQAIDPTTSAQTITAYMAQVYGGDASSFGIEFYSTFAVGSMLFLMTLVLTLIGSRVLAKYREAYD